MNRAQSHRLATLSTARMAIGCVLLLAILLLSVVAAGGAAGQQIRPVAAASDQSATSSGRSPGELFRRTELYFGQSRPNGEVSEEDFAKFLDADVTPLFPDGLTLLSGLGQFAGSDGPVEERSKVLILLYPFTDRDADRDIEQIRSAYKIQFDQQSVLRVDTVDRVSF